MAAVWPMVSVPWPMTMPSAPRVDLLADGLGEGDVCSIAMFSEKTPKSFLVVRLQMSASSGTAP